MIARQCPARLLIALLGLAVSSCERADEQPDPTETTFDVVDGAAPENEAQTSSETAAERKARLREKAKTDPNGADAEAIDNMSRNELVATAINSAGFLCARVTSLQSVGGGQMLVDCVEYRNGTGRVSYRVDANSGTVEQR